MSIGYRYQTDDVDPAEHFRLDVQFLGRYYGKKPNFGFNGLGECVYYRTYSRLKEDGSKESFLDTAQRVVEGCYEIQRRHCRKIHIPWDYPKALVSAHEMFERMWSFKFLPPGRGLWMMGTPFVWERGSAALNNCFGALTEIITRDGIHPIGELAGTIQTVLTAPTPRHCEWVDAPISSFGVQRLWKLTLTRARIVKHIYTTEDHRWFVESPMEVVTKNLQPGMLLQSVFGDGIRWCVESVEETDRVEEVFCATVPNTGRFALADNILTGNCGFVSTTDIAADPAEPACFLMDMSMLGVGVGFDTRGAGKLDIHTPHPNRVTKYVIDDSREGWVDSMRVLYQSYTTHTAIGNVEYDYGHIRPAGAPIRGFGGKASGPGILRALHQLTRTRLQQRVGTTLSSVDIVDLMNYIGVCVVAGNVRRTSEIAFGEPDDAEYYRMKNPEAGLGPHAVAFRAVTKQLTNDLRLQAQVSDFAGSGIASDILEKAIDTWNQMQHHRWASNNSIWGRVGMSYDDIGKNIARNGEPGLAWLHNMRDYGRMIDGRRPGIDGRVMGANPCLEQSLESYELCTLVETFPAQNADADDFLRTLKFAYLYAKTVTLLPTHNARTNQVMLRNRRIGLSQSGIVQAFAKFGRRAVLQDFCDAGYNEIRRWDDIYSEWLCVQRSIKISSVKPSGSVSLLTGSTPGIHYPEASTYWRRMRISKDSAMLPAFQRAGYHIEQSVSDPNTMIVKFAISDERVPAVNTVSIWEQTINAVDYQRYWADNQVSCTIKFKPEEAHLIPRVLEAFEDQLKGISFLPLEDSGYAQLPYEPCTPQEVADYNANLSELDFSDYIYEGWGERFCDSDTCETRPIAGMETAQPYTMVLQNDLQYVVQPQP